MEMQKVPAAGFKIIGLNIAGIQRKLTVDNLMFPFKVIGSYIKAGKIIKDFKPDIAIGVGGYASFPLLYAASNKGLPTVIQEQNGYAGVANKFLAKKAEKVCVAYENMGTFFPKEKLIMTGNPVRKDILETAGKREEGLKHFNLSPEKKTILVIGGSLGARTINESINAGLEKLRDAGVQVVWQTGKGYFTKAEERTKAFENVRAFEFIYEMDLAYAVADIVISRAGALSISELSLVGKPSILVPSPNVAEDHQTKNAMALVNKNAAMLIKDENARHELIAAGIDLLKDDAWQQELSGNIKTLGRPAAASEIAEVVLDIVQKKRTKR
jgi:UDP-N-acetylglucosamine--N-acetylmuramyl-(pentapeptide) pyrophosphoryl-undecaprenol N-acetylglucosamine transferase